MTSYRNILVTEVKKVSDLDRVQGLVIPGGESTAISEGMIREGLHEAIRNWMTGNLERSGSRRKKLII